MDLKSQAGKKIIYQLTEKADIVLQNYAPGVAKKMGIDYETLSKINNKIIFISSTAFGESGPYSLRKGFDIIAHAASGVMSMYADEMGNPKGPGGSAYVDIGTAMLNAMSALAALYYRAQTGVGQKIETSLFNTGMALLAGGLIRIEKLDKELYQNMVEVLKTARANNMKHTQIIDRFAIMSLRNEQPESTRPIEVPDCNHRPSDRLVFPYYRVYQTKDGFISIAALTSRQRLAMCAILGVEDKFAHQSLGERNDQTYFHQKEVMKKIEGILGEKTTSEWIEILEEAGVPCGPLNYGVTIYNDPHALAQNMIWSLENPVSGPYQMVGNPIRFTKTPIKPTKGAPALGENSAEILKRLGYLNEQIEEWKKQGVIK